MSRGRDSIGRWISVLYRYRQRYLGRELEPVGIGPGQVQLLSELRHHGGLSQDELAAHLSLDKATTTRALQKLEEMGLVQRTVDPSNRRVKRVELSDRGHELWPEVRRVRHAWTEAIIADLSPEERATALELLRRMAENAERAVGAGVCCGRARADEQSERR